MQGWAKLILILALLCNNLLLKFVLFTLENHNNLDKGWQSHQTQLADEPMSARPM